MARLPIPGGDDGNWGTVLNDFLAQEHNVDGTLKIRTDAVLTNKVDTSDSRLGNTRVPTDGSVTDIKIASNAGIAATKIAGLATVATSGSYADLINKPSTAFVALTQVAYDAIPVKDPSTLYVITD